MKSAGFRLLTLLACGTTGLAGVRVEEVPERGVQPEVVVAADGVVHLVYLRGDPAAAEVRYTWRRPGEEWQPGKTVNSSGSRAVAMGSIRGPQLALGKAGTVHFLWNGVPGGKGLEAPLWYTRKPDLNASFEAERTLLGETTALDGGASVAADGKGTVVVAWHAGEAGQPQEESRRLVFVRTSGDDGKIFGSAEAINRTHPGVCACCSLRAGFDEMGTLQVFFRNAQGVDHRAMTLLSRPKAVWQSREIETWTTSACPMSSAALAVWNGRLLGVWETAGRIRGGWISDAAEEAVTVAPTGARHPAVAVNRQGSTLVAWTVGTGWNRGGEAAWQEFDATLNPRGVAARTEGVPVWGRVAVYAEPDGGFVVLR